MAGSFRIKRVYLPADDADGQRVLVDRLWPRGLSKAGAGIDLWHKEIGPSTALRRWFGHDPARFEEFRHRYFDELEGHADLIAQLHQLAAGHRVTLLYSAHDDAHNQAVVLKQFLDEGARHG